MKKLRNSTALKERELFALTIYGGLASLVLSFLLLRLGMYWIAGLCVVYAAISFWSLKRTVVFRLLFLFFLGLAHILIGKQVFDWGFLVLVLQVGPGLAMVLFSSYYLAVRVAFDGLRNGFRIPIAYAIFSTLFLSALVLSRIVSIDESDAVMILGYTFFSLLCLIFGSKRNLVLGLYSMVALLVSCFGVLFCIALMFRPFPGDPQAVELPFYWGAIHYIITYFMFGIFLHGWFVIFSVESRNENIGKTE